MIAKVEVMGDKYLCGRQEDSACQRMTATQLLVLPLALLSGAKMGKLVCMCMSNAGKSLQGGLSWQSAENQTSTPPRQECVRTCSTK